MGKLQATFGAKPAENNASSLKYCAASMVQYAKAATEAACISFVEARHKHPVLVQVPNSKIRCRRPTESFTLDQGRPMVMVSLA